MCLRSSDTVSFFLPFALLFAKTALPLAVAILSLKPCLFLLFLFEGWNVLFIAYYILSFFSNFGLQKYVFFLSLQIKITFFWACLIVTKAIFYSY